MKPERLDEDGFELLAGAVTPAWTERLAARIPAWELLPDARQRHGATFAISNLLQGDPELCGLLEACGVTGLVSEALGQPAFPIDALLFDKIPESNWKVPGHQDVVMPVATALEDLVAARIHLDDSPPDNGPLAVIPGSHRRRFSQRELAELKPADFRVCPAVTGDVLLMRPLLIHRSAPSATPLHRRVLHVVYAWRR